MKLHRKLAIFLSLITVLFFTSACSDSSKTTETKTASISKMALLVSTEWLSEHLNNPDLVVLDSSVIVEFDKTGKYNSISGQSNYDSGHIPSARFADLKGNLSGGDGNLDFVMPTPEQFRNAMSNLGVGNDSWVVIYSAKEQDWAARLWWMLRWAGFDQVAILDGGLKAWIAEGRPISSEPSKRPKTQFPFVLQQKFIANRDEVFAAINNNSVSIVDVLPEAHYRGEFSMYARSGHITSAVNMPSSNLMESSYFKSLDELDLMHDGDRNNRLITYCGGGVAASLTAFNMHRLGYTDVAVYMGSLQEWAANPENPMTKNVP